MKVEQIAIAKLKPDPNNARKHDGRNMAAISESIKHFGQVEPLIVQKSSSMVIGGNARLEVMKHQGIKRVDVVKLDIDDARAAALSVALNRTAELAKWDDAILAGILDGLPDEFDIEKLGFSDQELRDMHYDIGSSKPSDEWNGMPEFVNEDQEAFRKVIMQFRNAEDLAAFGKLLGQNLENARSSWFPSSNNKEEKANRYA